MIYKTCPLCGSNLDPGESCDCQKEAPRIIEMSRTEKEKIGAPALEQDTKKPPHNMDVAKKKSDKLTVNGGMRA